LNKDSITTYAEVDVSGRNSLPCTNEVFGGKDLAPGEEKYCFCSSKVMETPTMPLVTNKDKILDKAGFEVNLNCANWKGS
jgi:hypothetical protein